MVKYLDFQLFQWSSLVEKLSIFYIKDIFVILASPATEVLVNEVLFQKSQTELVNWGLGKFYKDLMFFQINILEE